MGELGSLVRLPALEVDLEVCLVVVPISLAVGILIGRFSASRSVRDYKEVLSHLSDKQAALVKRQLTFSLLHSRAQILSRFLLALYSISLLLLVYH